MRALRAGLATNPPLVEIEIVFCTDSHSAELTIEEL